MSAGAWVAALSVLSVGLTVAVVLLNHQRLTWKRDDLYRQDWQRKRFEGTHDGPYDLEMKGYRRG